MRIVETTENLEIAVVAIIVTNTAAFTGVSLAAAFSYFRSGIIRLAIASVSFSFSVVTSSFALDGCGRGCGCGWLAEFKWRDNTELGHAKDKEVEIL